jgi:hypothetical protein
VKIGNPKNQNRFAPLGEGTTRDGGPVRLKTAHAISVAVAGLLWLPSLAGATIQVSDCLRYDSKDTIVLEFPLQDWLLRKGAPPVKFDEMATSSHKNYLAEWEIKDSKLRLVGFEATINGRRVSIDEIIPGAKLPVDAVWFTGNLHVPTGPAFDVVQTVACWMKYQRLDVLEVKNGRVVGRQVKHNTSLQQLIEAEVAASKKKH